MLGKTKLFKLLYFLDFEHFKLRGRSVTGSEYFAWPKGPVPKALFDEFAHPNKDLSSCVSIGEVPTLNGGKMFKVSSKVEFDKSLFSKRELQIMKTLATRYRDANATQMVEETHLENRPWHQVYEVAGRKQDAIPYNLALNRQESEEMARIVRERKEIINNYTDDKDDDSRNSSF